MTTKLAAARIATASGIPFTSVMADNPKRCKRCCVVVAEEPCFIRIHNRLATERAGWPTPSGPVVF